MFLHNLLETEFLFRRRRRLHFYILKEFICHTHKLSLPLEDYRLALGRQVRDPATPGEYKLLKESVKQTFKRQSTRLHQPARESELKVF